MQENTTSVAPASAAVGFIINEGTSKILPCNTACTSLVTLDGEAVKDIKTSTHLVRIIDEHGESNADVKAWVSKARKAYLQLKNIWNSKQLSTNTKVRIFNTSDPLARHYQQKPTVGENKPDWSGGRNQEEVLEVDKIHI
ncbi:unnamed protein product [Schistosoma mattheei]|uniref:Uncharacterized protein n=1 Tax=Schistosoma mattheei TaxID=31246 RepID=A0A183NUR2_9TREM|nr:unnamed protein product [Schistosoma mattheei]